MKRNINLIVLTFEIVAIVVLHAVKIGEAQQHNKAAHTGIANTRPVHSATKHYAFLSIK